MFNEICEAEWKKQCAVLDPVCCIINQQVNLLYFLRWLPFGHAFLVSPQFQTCQLVPTCPVIYPDFQLSFSKKVRFWASIGAVTSIIIIIKISYWPDRLPQNLVAIVYIGKIWSYMISHCLSCETEAWITQPPTACWLQGERGKPSQDGSSWTIFAYMCYLWPLAFLFSPSEAFIY